jgi:hypothetical protein
MVKKRREGREQKPPEEEKRHERTWFCYSKIFNKESYRKLTGREEMSAFTLTSDNIFYVKMCMCKDECKSYHTKKRGCKD